LFPWGFRQDAPQQAPALSEDSRVRSVSVSGNGLRNSPIGDLLAEMNHVSIGFSLFASQHRPVCKGGMA
jgi:hypothetical protein